MSDTRQAVVRSDNLTGLGYLPDLQPFNQVERLTGTIAGIGGFALASPTICQTRRKPVFGVCCVGFNADIAMLHLVGGC